MGVGAIGAVGSVPYNPYIYNSKQVTSASLNKIDRISDDPTDGGVDFNAVNKVDEKANLNPLKKGESANFADILMSQMSMSQMNQARLLGGATEDAFGTGAAESAVTVE